MSPVEKLQAAIDRLTELREATTPAPWNVNAFDGRLVVAGAADDDDAHIILDVARAGSPYDGELVTVLHRTIDAQLAILGTARDLLARGVVAGTPNDVALADAILGES